jgi:hypothetical protein
MTEGLAIEIAKQIMKEQGVGESYLLRFRHFQIQPSKQVKIKSPYKSILLTPDIDTRMSSRTGLFDQRDAGNAEMQYVHSGLITIDNLNVKLPIQVKILQVIPILKKT